MSAKDERAAPLFRYLIRHLDRRKQTRLYVTAIEALGTAGGAESIDALKFALYQGDWTAPFETRRLRSAAANALRRIGTDQALDVLREATRRGARGVRSAAREALATAS
jgi:HEAT repeat protein